VRTRKSTQQDVADDELESWLHDLVGGEPTARRYRQRLRAEGTTPADVYVVGQDAATS
jgi:hypothetical protein